MAIFKSDRFSITNIDQFEASPMGTVIVLVNISMYQNIMLAVIQAFTVVLLMAILSGCYIYFISINERKMYKKLDEFFIEIMLIKKSNYSEFKFTSGFNSVQKNDELGMFKKKIQDIVAHASDVYAAQKLSDQAQKLAHDIRTPLSTLNLITTKITDLQIKELQISVVRQVNLIANNLLLDSNISNQDSQDMNHIAKTSLLIFLLDIQKEYDFKKAVIKRTIVFIFNNEQELKIVVSSLILKTIYPILNNLIQNAIDATSFDGKISIIVNRIEGILKFVVEDNGKGMPTEIIRKLGYEKISYNKNILCADTLIQSGNGLAIYNAKQDLLKLNGNLLIDSSELIGTKITLVIPLN